VIAETKIMDGRLLLGRKRSNSIFNAREFRAAAAAASYSSLWNIFKELIMRTDSNFLL
jgi:hypothetical protein